MDSRPETGDAEFGGPHRRRFFILSGDGKSTRGSNQPMPDEEEYDEVVRKLRELRKDPDRWEEYMADRAERALNHWRKK